jgi:hypothetical protein
VVEAKAAGQWQEGLFTFSSFCGSGANWRSAHPLYSLDLAIGDLALSLALARNGGHRVPNTQRALRAQEGRGVVARPAAAQR